MPEKCCPDEIGIVAILVEPMWFSTSTGHASVRTPTQLAGFHPDKKVNWRATALYSPRGKVKNELRGDGTNKYKYDYRNSYIYRACPETYRAVDAAIDRTRETPPPFDALNTSARNCTGIACQWVEAGGLVAPFPPDTPILAPAPAGYRGAAPGR